MQAMLSVSTSPYMPFPSVTCACLHRLSVIFHSACENLISDVDFEVVQVCAYNRGCGAGVFVCTRNPCVC